MRYANESPHKDRSTRMCVVLCACVSMRAHVSDVSEWMQMVKELCINVVKLDFEFLFYPDCISSAFLEGDQGFHLLLSSLCQLEVLCFTIFMRRCQNSRIEIKVLINFSSTQGKSKD